MTLQYGFSGRIEETKVGDDKLRSYIQLNTNAYLSEITSHFKVAPSGIPKALIRLKITRKKRLRFTNKDMPKSENNTPK